MIHLCRIIFTALLFSALSSNAVAQDKLPITRTSFRKLIIDQGWSFYDSTSSVRDIVVVKITKDSTMIAYLNFLDGIYSLSHRTKVTVADNTFQLTVTDKNQKPYLLASGFLESKEVMVLTLMQNPVPGINSMFDKGLTLRLEKVNAPKEN